MTPMPGSRRIRAYRTYVLYAGPPRRAILRVGLPRGRGGTTMSSRPWPPFEDLLRGLDDPNRYARCRAAQGLGEGRDPRAVEPLLRALRYPAGDVRAKAAVALGRLRDERALGPLIAAMGDAKVSVRSGAAAAVKKFGKR